MQKNTAWILLAAVSVVAAGLWYLMQMTPEPLPLVAPTPPETQPPQPTSAHPKPPEDATYAELFLWEFDNDNDEVVTPEEFMAPIVELYGNLDVNGNGEITAEEYRETFAPGLSREELRVLIEEHGYPDPFDLLANQFDQDGDGKVSRDEYLPVRGAEFEVLDLNSDGQIDAEEAAEMEGSPPAQSPATPLG